MDKQKKSLMDRLTDFTNKISELLGRFANTDIISSVVAGLVSVTPIIMIGSIFLILYVLGSPDVGTSGKPLIGFLAPWATKFSWMNSLTMNMMSLYCAVAIPYHYGQKKKMNTLTCSLLGLATFLIFTINGYDEAGGILVTAFSATGLFVCIITSIIGVQILKFFLDRNITIKMPDSVPPNVGNAFGALLPFATIFSLAWIIRTIMNFDMVSWLNTILEPIITSSDSLWMAMFVTFVCLLLWSVGLHGDNMFLALFTPFGLMWVDQNASALADGVSKYDLPNILAGLGNTGLIRLTVWTAAVWPLLFLMIISKKKQFRTIGFTALAPGIFTIVEPVIYGLPIALNPYLMIPFILSGTISSGIGYLLMSTSFFGKFYAVVPWATPPFLLGPLGTGDVKTALIPIISFAVGMVIYLPFWKVYNQSIDAEEQQKLEEASAAEMIQPNEA
ncbi:PTS system, cellobiose-specific IIC component [Enterococcus malodoratus]|uniref:PTS sugar transporter subunit IIC n=1 Tax=Enterococcus malodoratus TaxID=71451 RepID=UPI0008AF9AFF|nr:PTS transporter subunit EIIC [Enterococcus malodoratus]SET54331.1 PTS system, cellobiose-specific IIC component [Enterococcus malodoratus]